MTSAKNICQLEDFFPLSSGAMRERHGMVWWESSPTPAASRGFQKARLNLVLGRVGRTARPNRLIDSSLESIFFALDLWEIVSGGCVGSHPKSVFKH